MNVLIVDPSRSFHQLVAELFSSMDVRPIAVSSTSEALDILKRIRVGYICSSMYLEDGTGADLCRALRKQPEHAFTPFLLLSSESADKLRQTTLDAGITDVFRKSDLPSLASYLHRLSRQYDHIVGRVLLVEDSISQAGYYRDILAGHGLSVDVADDGRSALECLAGTIYDLVILDIVLPGELSGIAVTNQIRRLEGDAGDVPILALTAFDENARRVELFYVGINDYLAKPVAAEELVARTRNLILSSRALREMRTQVLNAGEEACYREAHDPVTGLLNRWRFEMLLGDRMLGGSCEALVFVEAGGLPLVQGFGGSAAGEAFLGEFARRLEAGALTTQIVVEWARLNTRHFAALLPVPGGAAADELVTRLLAPIAERAFTWQTHEFAFAPRACIVDRIDCALEPADVLMHAEASLPPASGTHELTIRHASPRPDLGGQGPRHKDTVAALLAAIRQGNFELYYQTLNPTRPHLPPGYEILIRMRDPEGRLVAPGLFLPTAELYGLVTDIDRWVISHTCEWLAGRGQDARCQFVSINLSGLTLSDEGLASFVADEISRTGIAPARLVFEITETAAVSDPAAARRLIEGVRQLGCRFALDDFGSGVSSFAQLRNFPLDMLKIDGSFVRNILDSPIDQAIIWSIREVAMAGNMRTVAEYVETATQVERLSELGIDYLQGYAFGQPQPL